MTRREYAISLGLATPGRGRLSREAHAACDDATANGTVFSDTTAATRTASSTSRKTPINSPRSKGPSRASTGASTIVEDGELNVQDAVYSNSQMWVSTSGQLVNGRQVCSPCGYSLQYHRCSNPSAVVSPGVLEAVTLV